MTHSLHRLGSREELRDDFVLLIMAGPDRMKDAVVAERMREVWDILSQYESDLANFGTLRGGGHRKTIQVLKEKDPWIIHAVFSSRQKLESCLRELQCRDLGISVTISGCSDDVLETCADLGLTPHTVQHSLGIHGRRDRLPAEDVLSLSTMCGHAMVSPNLIAHIVQSVSDGAMSHAEAAEELSKMCDCGIFNKHRAERLLKMMA